MTRTRDGDTRVGSSTVPASGESMLSGTFEGGADVVEDEEPFWPPHPAAVEAAISATISSRGTRSRRRSADQAVTAHLADDQLGGDRGAGHRQVHPVGLANGAQLAVPAHPGAEPPVRRERRAEIEQTDGPGK